MRVFTWMTVHLCSTDSSRKYLYIQLFQSNLMEHLCSWQSYSTPENWQLALNWMFCTNITGSWKCKESLQLFGPAKKMIPKIFRNIPIENDDKSPTSKAIPSPGRRGNGGVLVSAESSTHGDFFGYNSEAFMYWMSVSPLLVLPTLNLELLCLINTFHYLLRMENWGLITCDLICSLGIHCCL